VSEPAAPPRPQLTCSPRPDQPMTNNNAPLRPSCAGRCTGRRRRRASRCVGGHPPPPSRVSLPQSVVHSAPVLTAEHLATRRTRG
jgi:hypothetical protein